MNGVEMLLENYHMLILTGGLAGILLLILISCFGVFAVSRRLKRLQKGLESYLSVILAEEDEPEEEPERETEEKIVEVSTQEQQMRQSIQEKRMKQQEAVLDAVLQELFP